MTWVGMVDGIIFPIVCFEISVNYDVYLEKVLKNSVWHAFEAVSTRRQYWFLQDGASCHVTAQCLQFLSSERRYNFSSHRSPLASLLSCLNWFFLISLSEPKQRHKCLDTNPLLNRRDKAHSRGLRSQYETNRCEKDGKKCKKKELTIAGINRVNIFNI